MCSAAENKLAAGRLNLVLPVRTESFPSAAQRKLAVLTAIAEVLAGRKPSGLLQGLGRHAEHRALLLCIGRAKPRAHFQSGLGGSLVEL